jgi:hypothetical protein
MLSKTTAQASVPCVKKDQKNSSLENEQRPETPDLSLDRAYQRMLAGDPA